jgi:hypothetical protein
MERRVSKYWTKFQIDAPVHPRRLYFHNIYVVKDTHNPTFCTINIPVPLSINIPYNLSRKGVSLPD